MARAAPAPAPTKGERTRQRLLDVAERVFGEKGFHTASVTEITREAGVANGTFYVYFPSKTDLFCELVRDRGHEMRAGLHEATVGLTDRAEIERAGFRAFLDWVRRHPNLYRIVRNAEFVDREVFEEWYRKLGKEYERALKRAMRSGEVEAGHAEALAYCLMGLGDFTGMRWVLWEEGAEVRPEVFETVMGFVLRGLGIDGADGAQRRG